MTDRPSTDRPSTDRPPTDSVATDRWDALTARIERAERLVRDDPGEARLDAQRIADEASELGASDPSARGLAARGLAARAYYVLAQAAAGTGSLSVALVLIDRAQAEFEAAGRLAEAVRTNLGRINVLNEMGRHIEAIAVGEGTLATLPLLHSADPAVVELAAATHQNLGLCYELTGRFNEALAAYATAESRYRELADDEGVGEVAYDRGLVLLALGRVAEALSAFDTAVEVFSQRGLRAHLAASLTSSGEAYLMLGEFARGLALLQQAGRELAGIDAPWRDRSNLLALARAYLALNCFPEALDAYEAAEQWLAATGMATDRARATWGVALARAGLHDLEGARRALEDAAHVFAFSGQTQSLAAVLVERSALESERGERGLARRLASEALQSARDSGAVAEMARAHLRLAEVSGVDDPAAGAELDAAAALAEQIGLGPLQIAVWQAMGRYHLGAERFADARRWFERAVERIETVRATIAHEELLGNFLHDKAVAYNGLVRCELATAGPGFGTRVFAASERARSRGLRELVDGQVSRTTTVASAADSHLAGELSAVHLELMQDASPERRAALRERSQVLERRIARQRLDRLDATGARRDADASGEVGESEESGIDLPVVAYHCLDDEIVVMVVVPGADPEVVVLEVAPAAVARHLDRLAIQWDRCRLGSDFVARHETNLVGAAQRVLRSLYDDLVRPVIDRLPPSGPIVILPHGLLHAVPWTALHDGDEALIDRYTVSLGPSRAIVRRCRDRVRRAVGKVSVVGVADEFAPAVADEVTAVAAHHPGSQVLLGDDAQGVDVLAALDGARIVHLAGHGWWRSDNPMYSAVRVADRWLTAAELMNVDLEGALVVLSACDTGRVRALPGDELHGLVRAVLGAGAATLVACAWPADDAASRDFMEAFHGLVAGGMPVAAAARSAQLELRERRSHPYYWAGFQVIGAP